MYVSLISALSGQQSSEAVYAGKAREAWDQGVVQGVGLTRTMATCVSSRYIQASQVRQ